MVTFWNNGREQTVIERRDGGPGNPWSILSISGGYAPGSMDAPSGGRQSVESRWGRGRFGRIYLGANKTGNPERFTFNVMARIVKSNFPNGLLGDLGAQCDTACTPDTRDIRVRQRCEDITNRIDYEFIANFVDAQPTSTSFNGNLADDKDGENAEVDWSEALSAGFFQGYDELGLLNVSGTHTDAEINHGIYICNNEWWTVSDADTTPGYAGTDAPLFGWTTDGGTTWTFQYIDALLDADALMVDRSGPNAVVVSAGGIAYAPISQIKNNPDNPPWSPASPAGTGAYSLGVSPNGTIWYGGASGVIRKSTDNGFSSSAVTTISGAPNLLSVSAPDDNLVWFAGGNGGGSNGTLVRYLNGEFKTISGHNVTGVTVKAVVPDGRPDEVYVFGSDGEIAYSKNAQADTPTFTTLTFPGTGDGSIIDLQFSGYNGDVMFIIQSNSAVDRFRVLRDLSGGAGGGDVELVNDFEGAPGGLFRSFAPANPNLGLGFGTVSGSYALIGKVSDKS